MTNRIAKRRCVFLVATQMIAAPVITAAVFNPKPQKPKRQLPKEPPVTSMPPVYSKIKTLEVVTAWIVNQEIGVPAARVVIRNNSDKDIVAVDLVCGNGAVTENGLNDEEHPVVVVKAHETFIMEMNFSAMTFGAPLVVSAVTYADGTEEGDEKSLRAMHLAREHDRAVIKARKEQERQKGSKEP